MDQPARILSLFAGVGALDIAARRAFPGARTVALVEREAYAVAVLAARMADGSLGAAPIWAGGIEQLDYADLAGASIDTIVAGFPCQPASVAGRRGGVDDDRWLWPEVVRAARELHARWLLLENVPGLLSVNAGAGYRGILADLAALGFDADWLCLHASHVGAPHHRKRWFLLAHRAGRRARTESDKRSEQPDLSAPRRRDAGRRDGTVDVPLRGRHEHENDALRPGRNGAVVAGESLGDADLARADAYAASGGPRRATGEPDGRVEHATLTGLDSGRGGLPINRLGAFPPGPADRDGWARVLAARPDLAPSVESPVRVVADGAAAGLDVCVCPRTDRLRALGNSAVVDQAATAWRALWERLVV